MKIHLQKIAENRAMNDRDSLETRALALNAAAAALYAVLTVALAPISYGPMQVRVSEAMTLLAFVNPRFLPGLVIGCLAANAASPLGPIDMVAGTGATFLGLWPMRFVKSTWTASLFPVVSNGLIIAGELVYLSDIPMSGFWVTALYIGAGEFLAVAVCGSILVHFLESQPALNKWLHF
jgi:uncharacterized membrane protein